MAQLSAAQSSLSAAAAAVGPCVNESHAVSSPDGSIYALVGYSKNSDASCVQGFGPLAEVLIYRNHSWFRFASLVLGSSTDVGVTPGIDSPSGIATAHLTGSIDFVIPLLFADAGGSEVVSDVGGKWHAIPFEESNSRKALSVITSGNSGPMANGTFVVSNNSCNPDCAQGTLTYTTYRYSQAAGAFELVDSSNSSSAKSSLPSFNYTSESASEPNWYALGDSYIAGEGTFSYISGTDTPGDYCHQSQDSYAPLLGVPLDHFFACSGATIDDIENGQALSGSKSKVYENSSQVNKPGLSSAKVILLSAGGDSLDFSKIMTECVNINPLDENKTTKACDSALQSAKATLGSVEQSPLIALISKLHKVAPKAWIVVVGYPRLFLSKPTNECSEINTARQNLLNTFATTLDSKTQATVRAERRTGIPVWYDSTLNSLNAGELCGGQSNPFYTNDLNGLTTDPGLLGLSSGPPSLGGIGGTCHTFIGLDVNTPLFRLASVGVCVESFHPTPAGYVAFESSVVISLKSLSAFCTTACKSPPPAPVPSWEGALGSGVTVITAGTPASGTNTPVSVVDDYIAALLSSDPSSACSYVLPPQQSGCSSAVSLFTADSDSVTGPATIGDVAVDGTQALAGFTGNLCLEGPDYPGGVCTPNSDPAAIFSSGESFATLYSQALAEADSSATQYSLTPLEMVGGTWYVDAGNIAY